MITIRWNSITTTSIFSLHYYTPLCFTSPINKYISKYLMKKVFGQTNDTPIVNGRKSRKKIELDIAIFLNDAKNNK